jgi:pimeloyl-ACP methyl ester carboxylesterase
MLRALLTSVLRSPDYGPIDLVRTVRGLTASQAALLPRLADTDLTRDIPRLEVPLTIVQGRYDQVVPAIVAQRYFEAVSAAAKRFEWFEESAHTPQLEEPTKLREVIVGLRPASRPTPVLEQRTRSPEPDIGQPTRP